MWLILVVTLLACLAIFSFIFSNSQDPYGSFHVKLNVLPGQTVATTEWLNMGYWKNTRIFPQACEALALRVIQSAGCKLHGNVLDVGYGSGDSLLLQLTHPLVPRPSLLVGVTSLAEHHSRSQRRIAKSASKDTEIRLFHSDAIHRRSSIQGHPLSPDSILPQFDSITAIDCAYHFDTRMVFLEQSLKRLAPNGRIALADICFSNPSSWISLLLGVPKVNMVCQDEYLRMLIAIGYEDVQLEDITEDVFPGFIEFLKSRGMIWSIFAVIVRVIAARGARFVIVSARKANT